MVPELLQGRRRKSNIGDDGGDEEGEEEGGGSDDEGGDRGEGGNVEGEIKPEVSEIKMELDAGQTDREAPHSSSNASGLAGNIHGRAERPSVIMFQRSAEHVQTQREDRDGERSPGMPGYGDMAVSGDKHFSMWIGQSREIPLFLAFLNRYDLGLTDLHL